ncbi:MAG: hypothetical protein CMC96_15045 [Flavobacteriales bacterium]|nr:hypothetical protein [Flavobacteriales bacterium]|tara:strand:+ start:33908 stop:35200 length:1293 start_codon:yes stop_codon:yes gene_type:complete
MKNKLLALLFCLGFLMNNSSVANELKQELIEINKYWKFQTDLPENFYEVDFPKNEKSQIQLHLKLVHQVLKERSVHHLNKKQKKNRSTALTILKQYYQNEQFPINLHHSYRIPYFIDDFGTACAVGHLIIETGFPEVSKMIAQQNNYSYLEEMNYPEVELWAKEFGFTIDELKWIQPGYAPYCAPGTKKDPVCHDGPGCINPDFAADSLIPPYNVTYEYNDGSGWEVDTVGYIHMYGARIGQHKVTCIDSLNTTKVYYYTINNVPDISIQANINHQTDSTNCNAVLHVQTSVDPPYQLDLIRSNPNQAFSDSNGYFKNLCAGNYTIVVYDSNYCQKTRGVQIYNLATSLNEKEIGSIKLFPNPFSENFMVSFESNSSFEYKIYDLSGRLVQRGRAKSDEEINLKSAEKGVYFLEIIKDNERYTEKIVKAY